jgi:type VI secretion system protein ImpC
MADAKTQNQTPAVEQKFATDSGLLDKIVEGSQAWHTADERSAGKEWVDTFVQLAQKKQLKRSRNTEATIADAIADLDKRISAQLNEIMHDAKFQKLEASWRGLHYLVNQTETSVMLKIKVFNISQQELKGDLENAVEFDQSTIFKKVYEEEYGQLGGQPYGLLVGDYEFGRSPEDVSVLSKMSGIAAAAHAPFLASTTSSMFGMTSFTDLGAHRDLAKIFDSDLYIKWRSFRESPDSRYVGLAMPHMLLRDPYGEGSKTIEAFNYEEKVDGKDHSKYLWGNAAYALATRITDAFAKYEWCAAIRGVQGGGLVENLPAHTFQTDEGDTTVKCPTEIAITDRREAELSKLGFIPLCHHKGSDKAVFFGTQSCQKPKKYQEKDVDANANASLSARLQYILAISRFAHFLKVMMRDKVGSFVSQSSLQTELNAWIANYVLLDDNASQEAKASHPLREARIDVREVAGQPGSFEAVAFLRPHYQLEELTIALSLVAKIPPPPK